MFRNIRAYMGSQWMKGAIKYGLPAHVSQAVWTYLAESHSELPSRLKQTESEVLALIARTLPGKPTLIEGPILFDAMWPNQSYFFRMSLLRAALGTANADEYAVIGRYRAKSQASAVNAIGIQKTVSLYSYIGRWSKFLEKSKLLLSKTKCAADILDWKLDYDLPASIVYDQLLKRQRAASVDLNAPEVLLLLAEALAENEAAHNLLDQIKPKLVVLSHTVQASYGALAWGALLRGVPVIAAPGSHGLLRFQKLFEPMDVFNVSRLPAESSLIELPNAQAERLEQYGRRIILDRTAGNTADLGARLAYGKTDEQPTREEIFTHFDWKRDLPVVAVYAANWFDYPHYSGMSNFTDYKDWLLCTLSEARKNTKVNWLFRSHPCDSWYGGVTLSDLMQAREAPHVGLSPKKWHGASVMAAADAIVTVLGTAGLEYSSIGKPALLADRGWYSQCGFGITAKSREDYVSCLQRNWWRGWGKEKASKLARISAAIYFGRPLAGPQIMYPDDDQQDRALPWQLATLSTKAEEIRQEVDCIREWWQSDEKLYQHYRMLTQ